MSLVTPHTLTALSQFELKDVAVSLNNLGLNYEKQKDFDRAIQFYQKTIEIQLQIGDEEVVATFY